MSNRSRALLAHTADILTVNFDPVARARKPRDARFWSHVDQTARGDGCWLWTGSVTQSTGYGAFHDDSPETGRKTMRAAHRVAFELARGRRLDPGQRVLHAKGCSKLCCRPGHLRTGTAAENSADAKAEGRLKGSKLDAAAVLRLVALHRKYGLEKWVLAQRFGVSNQTVTSILSGKTWGTVTGIAYKPGKTGRPPKGAKVIPYPTIVDDDDEADLPRIIEGILAA
jgi:hypothetical protein